MDAESWPRVPLPWQQELWQRREESVTRGVLAHATLLAGPSGIGKAHFQMALAARLLCESPSAGTACGQCRSCTLLEAGSNPDLLRVEPTEDSRVIKIDQVRELIDYAVQTPTLAPCKVILLGPAEVMNIASANALLKCLEEPTPSTVLLLYSHQMSLLPATVRSRCQIQAMPIPARPVALEWLKGCTGDESTGAELLELGSNRPLVARALFMEGGQEAARALEQGLDGLLDGSISPLEFPALMAELDLEAVFILMQGRLEKVLRQRAEGDGMGECRGAFALHDELARLRRSVANGANPNRQLVIEDCAGVMARALRV